MKSATTASIAIPFESKMPVCPVPMNSMFLLLADNLSFISHAVVILPVSQSLPTTNKTGTLRFFQVPSGK